MARAKKATKAATKGAGNASPLQVARDSINKVISDTQWEVDLDPSRLRASLPHLPTGSIILDWLIGGEPNDFGVPPCPGLPKKKMMQLYGMPSSGKTTVALTTAATTIANGGTVGYLDWENEIDPSYAKRIGVPIGDPNKFSLAQPETMEQGIRICAAWIKAGVDLVVIDSIGACVPQVVFTRELDKLGEEERMSLRASIWSKTVPILKGLANRSGTHVIAIAQVRSGGFGNPGGATTTVQGGKAWLFYSALRMKLRRIKSDKGKRLNPVTGKMEERAISNVIRAKLEKCKVSAHQGMEQDFFIRFGEGIDDMSSLIDIGLAHRAMTRSGSWYSWAPPNRDEIRCQGKDKFRETLLEDPELYPLVLQQIAPLLIGSGAPVAEVEEEADNVEILDDPDLASLDDILG